VRTAWILCAALIACHSDPAPSAAEAAALAPLLAGPAPSLAGPVSPLAFGMSRADARRSAPTLLTERRDDLDNYGSSIPGFATAELRVSFGHGWLDSVDLALPHRDTRALLTAHWGPPVGVKDRWIWRNPTARIRAVLRRLDTIDVVSIEPYTPVAALVEAMEAGGPFIGASLSELRAKLGKRLHEETAQELAESRARIQNHAPGPIEFGSDQPLTSVALPDLELEPALFNDEYLEYRDDTVTAVSFTTKASTPETAKALKALADTATRHVVVTEDAGEFKIALTAKYLTACDRSFRTRSSSPRRYRSPSDASSAWHRPCGTSSASSMTVADDLPRTRAGRRPTLSR